MKPRVFLSYSSQDRESAVRVADALAESGVECFLDQRDLTVGDPFVERLMAELENCMAVVLLISEEALSSQWVPFEVGYAMALGKRILPFISEGSAAGALPQYLQRFHCTSDLMAVKAYLERLPQQRDKWTSEDFWHDWYLRYYGPGMIWRDAAFRLSSNEEFLNLVRLSDRQEQVAKYFDNISDCMGRIVERFDAGSESAEPCGELEGYATKVRKAIQDFVGEVEAQEIEERVRAACKSRHMMFLRCRGGDPEARWNRDDLSRATGEFKALANSIRARKNRGEGRSY